MRTRRSFFLWVYLVVCMSSGASAAIVVDFEELNVFTGTSPSGGQYYNGNDGSGVSNDRGWISQGVFFSNSYNGDSLPDFDFWSGWAYSSVTDAVDGSFTNQYAALPGGGSNGAGGIVEGQNYAVAFGGSAYFNIPLNLRLQSLEVSNTTYAGITIREGSIFSEPFGGLSGNEPDVFQVTFTGYDALAASGNVLGEVTVDLADYRFADNSLDYVLSEWLDVDLSSLAGARSIGLSFFSTDVGPFGINTPTYVAVDNVTFSVVPEPSGVVLVLGAMAVFAMRRRPNARH